jgi:hypothetical protein
MTYVGDGPAEQCLVIVWHNCNITRILVVCRLQTFEKHIHNLFQSYVNGTKYENVIKKGILFKISAFLCANLVPSL